MTEPKSPRRRKPAVPKPEPVPEVVPASLADAVASGDRREALVALRDELARRLATAERDVPGLARQLQSVLRDIAELPAPAERSTLDEIASRRAARRAAAGQ